MSKSGGSHCIPAFHVMILSSMLTIALCSAHEHPIGPWRSPPCAAFSRDTCKGRAGEQSAGVQPPFWFVAAPSQSPFVWDRGIPVLPARWSISLQGPVSADLSLRPRDPQDPPGFQSAVLGTHTGRVLLVEWDRHHSRLASAWNVDGMVTGKPRWLDRERFVVGTEADSLHAFARGRAQSTWRRHVGRCPHRRAPGPLGARCDLGVGLEWQHQHQQVLAVADGVYALDAHGRVRWQWPARAGLAKALGSPVKSDAQGNAYLGSQMGYAISLDPQGTLRWSVDLGAPISRAPMVFGHSRVCFFADNGRLTCVNPRDGQALWSFKAPAKPRGPLLGDPQRGTLWGASADGSVFALDSWGHELWRRRLRGLAAQGLVARDDQELVAVVGGPEPVALGIRRKSGRLSWQARLQGSRAGRVQVAGERWLMQLRPQGELVGYWLPHRAERTSTLVLGPRRRRRSRRLAR